MKKKSLAPVHPLVTFWLGLLTGAVIVGLIFSYKALNPADYESFLLRYPSYGSFYKTTDLYDSGTRSIGTPPGGYVNPYSIGTPPGGITDPYSIGTPSGG